MRYHLFGRTGLRVSELVLGTMTFGSQSDEAVSKQIFNSFTDAGGNFIDSANIYSGGKSEEIVGRLIAPKRDEFVLATKFTGTPEAHDPNSFGNGRKNMVQSVEASLKRLGTDYIDLLWVHAWDGSTPADETMSAFHHLVNTGKVLYIGVSDWPAWCVAQANTMAHLRGWTAFAGLQVEYSLVQRSPERELIPMARSYGLGITPWSPLGGGLLTDRYKTDEDFKQLAERRTEMFFDGVEHVTRVAHKVREVAQSVGKSTAQVALNWLRQQDTLPILGASRPEQLKDTIASLEWDLIPEQMKTLDEASQIDLGFPHDFLTSPPVRKFFFGGEVGKNINWRPPQAY